jgi:hypothetical protein
MGSSKLLGLLAMTLMLLLPMAAKGDLDDDVIGALLIF